MEKAMMILGLLKKQGVGEDTFDLENTGLFGCFFLLICASDFFLMCHSVTFCGQENISNINK